MDACIAAVCFWLLGYGLAYGDTTGNFLGTTQFALVDDSFTATEGSKLEGLNFHTWFFQWAFAATAATIVSGSVAERCSLPAYFIYSAVITTFIYPVVVHCQGVNFERYRLHKCLQQTYTHTTHTRHFESAVLVSP